MLEHTPTIIYSRPFGPSCYMIALMGKNVRVILELSFFCWNLLFFLYKESEIFFFFTVFSLDCSMLKELMGKKKHPHIENVKITILLLSRFEF